MTMIMIMGRPEELEAAGQDTTLYYGMLYYYSILHYMTLDHDAVELYIYIYICKYMYIYIYM